MLKRCVLTRLGIFAALLSSSLGNAAAGAGDTNREALVLQDFSQRLEAYVKLRKQAKDDAPSIKDETDPVKIAAHQKGLAERIRAARAVVKQGAIFTRPISAYFRKILGSELRERDAPQVRGAIMEDNPQGQFVPRVNQPYPEKAPLSTVPPELLLRLPRLPEEVDYRFVGRYLILRDTQANLIIDFIPNALPPAQRRKND